MTDSSGIGLTGVAMVWGVMVGCLMVGVAPNKRSDILMQHTLIVHIMIIRISLIHYIHVDKVIKSEINGVL